ncbi:MAG: hypothetical protein K2Y23_18735 [Cyanobacteria bacterium]|nr:hypothetical protein [Cyanobacteriota bacterium]
MLEIARERFERRLTDECGKLRVEMTAGFGGVRTLLATELGGLRAEMIHRNGELLKWVLLFLVAQLTAIAALLALFR